jgi:hypothetical protein
LQNAILALLLIVGFLAAVAWFVVMGALQARRTGALARWANETGMLFAADDPFDLPRKYANFALVAGGHSGRACNVTHGPLEGLPVRAFDFHYELGHGTRRLSLHYGVVAAETGQELPAVLMWNERQPGFAPLAALCRDAEVRGWSFRGSASLAALLGGACPDLADRAACIETRGTILMLAAPVRLREGHARDLAAAGKLLAAMRTARVLRAGDDAPGVADTSVGLRGVGEAKVETQPPG